MSELPMLSLISKENTTPQRALVVDDDEMILQMLVSALSAQKLPNGGNRYEVMSVSSGTEGLELLREAKFDIIVTDLIMPGMDGYRFLEIVHSEFPNIPVIVFTGFPTIEGVTRVLKLGAANFLVKPFAMDDMLDAIRKTLFRKRAHDMPQRALPCLEEETLTFEIPPDLEIKSGVIHFLTEKLVGVGICEPENKHFVSIALDEAITNAIFYGCLDLPGGLRETRVGSDIFMRLLFERCTQAEYIDKRVRIEMRLTPDRVQFIITDPGDGFDPPDMSSEALKPTELSRLHGRGLLLIATFMDEVSFNEKANQVTLVKYRGA